jgi:hypothetical protein
MEVFTVPQVDVERSVKQKMIRLLIAESMTKIRKAMELAEELEPDALPTLTDDVIDYLNEADRHLQEADKKAMNLR